MQTYGRRQNFFGGGEVFNEGVQSENVLANLSLSPLKIVFSDLSRVMDFNFFFHKIQGEGRSLA
jgi:hypothetical protein